MIDVLRDFRYALRNLARHSGFTVIAVLTLALGIGANSAIFSVVHAVLLRPLPYPDAERLVRVHQLASGQSETVLDVMYLDYLDWRRESRTFDDMAAFASSSGGFLVEIDDETSTLEGKLVTWNLMSVLGVRPLHGRLFLPEDDRVGAEPVVLISEGLWRQRFAADPAAVGRSVRVSGEAFRIVGVLPAGSEYPVGARLWLPVVSSLDPSLSETRSVGFLNLVGRLVPGTSHDQAAEELSAIIDRVTNPQKPANDASYAALVPLDETLVGKTRRPLWILLAAAGLVLLIACANVGNLLIVRGIGRRRELAIRTALGAGRRELMRLALIENGLLALAGGVAGLVLAWWGIGAVMAWSPLALFRGETIGVDATVLGFGLVLTVIAALIFGVLPLVQRRQNRLQEDLKDGEGRSTRGAAGRRWLDAFAVSQVTLALVLLIGSGLLIRSLHRLYNLDVGFDRDRTLTVAVALFADEHSQGEVAHQVFDDLMGRVSALPGVEGVSGALRRPLESPLGFDYSFTIEGRPPEEQPSYPRLDYVAVTPGYFENLGVALREGRAFDSSDREGAPPVVIISESTRQRFWGDENPVGQRMKWGPPESSNPWMEIIGISGGVRSRQIESVSLNVFVPYRQNPWPLRNLVIRADGYPLALAPPLRELFHNYDPDVRASEIATTGELVTRSMARPRFNTLLLGLFGALALVIGAIGIYGVLAYSVVSRRRELGVRMALGATRGNVLRLALGSGLKLALVGIVIGSGIALLASQVMASIVYEIPTRDLATYLATAFVLLAVAMLACVIPAWRASRVDPLTVLRSE